MRGKDLEAILDSDSLLELVAERLIVEEYPRISKALVEALFELRYAG